MELKNRVEVKLEKHDKVSCLCDQDCPIGQIYDFTCALQQFCIKRMNDEAEKQKAASEKKPEEPQG